jgi:glycosyltransferase involved in cell wall biosynthesis
VPREQPQDEKTRFARYVRSLCVAAGIEVSSSELQKIFQDKSHPTRAVLTRKFKLVFPIEPQPSLPRVGIFHTSFNQTGGTETWARHFVRLMQNTFQVLAVGCLDGDLHEDRNLPLHRGLDKMLSLARECDVCVCWGLEKEFMDAIRRAKRPDAAIVHVHHGDLASDWSQRIIAASKQHGDAMVAVNQRVAEMFQCDYIPNAVDTSRIANGLPATASPVVLWLHRYSEEKRPVLSVQACRHLPSHWRFIFAGNRTPTRTVAEIAAAGDPRFEFLDHANPKEQFARANIFLSLSNTDGFGYSMAEAAIAGLRVVATPVGVALDPHLVHQIPDDRLTPEKIAGHLMRASQEHKEAAAASQLARQQFSEQAFANSWRSLLTRVTSS